MPYPRRTCRICARDIAIPGGRYARHDPPGPRATRELISCPASHTAPPPLPGQPVVQEELTGLELPEPELTLFS